ncbi:uncharacterized protein TNCV_212221 [Trichonephila clavipes]|nr:uncharacterized protein TNCV_212221 [Trichonephila clavipes]
MGLSQADAARRLNVSRSVVQRLWDQYQSEDSVSRRPVPGRPRATTPAEDSFLALSARRRRTTTVPLLRCRPLSSIRKKNLRYYGAKSSSQCRSVCKKTSCVRSPQRTTAKEPLMLGKRTCFLDAATMGFCAVHRQVQIYNESDPGRLLIWREQRTRYHQSNTVERHSYRGGGILVWAGISLGGHTDLHMFHGGTVTGLRYRDETLDPYVHPLLLLLVTTSF